MSVRDLPRILRTVRYLRPSQLGWRLWYLVERRLGWGENLPAPPSEIGSSWVSPSHPFPQVPVFEHPGPAGPETVAMLAEGEIVHLNYRLRLGRKKPYWRLGNQERDRLWIVTLHYHRWIYELAKLIAAEDEHAPQAELLLKDYLLLWIQECELKAPGARELAWNCFTLATRLEWWIRSCLLLGADRLRRWADFTPFFLRSMWRQAAYLYTHPENDLLANHLVRDAVGLAWSGRFFAGKEVERWLHAAEKIGAEQAAEQVLPDGAHFELSPMYHLQVMEDFAKLFFLLPPGEATEILRPKWVAMVEYLRWIRHPDSHIPLFNDGALNAAAEPEQMFALAPRFGVEIDSGLPRGGKHFPAAGMIVWHGEPWTVFFDAGPVGASYQPGHAHADTFTLECSCRGQRFIVDPGTHNYDADEKRAYDRATRSHNTVCIDHQNSSEVWHIFRVGRRAQPRDVKVEISEKGLSAAGVHTGYDHLPGRPRHRRFLQVEEGGMMNIVDRIEGRGRHHLEGGFLLAPEWKVQEVPGGWEVQTDNSRVQLLVSSSPQARLFLEIRPYHPEYGLELSAPRLGWEIETQLPFEIKITLVCR